MPKENCNEYLRRKGDGYPRTCRECQLGPCKHQTFDKMKVDNSPEKVVEELNAGCASENIPEPFLYSSNGFCAGITFLGVPIWDTENHSRYDHDDNEIDLELYVRREAKKILAEIKKFKL